MFLYNFGTDGIREKYPFLNDIIAYIIAKVFAKILKDSNKAENKVLIGYDSRFNSYSLALSISSALVSEGIKTELSESYISTPALAFLTKYKKCYGIQITASHNTYNYNGIKIFFNGLKIDHALEKKIENTANSYLEKFHQDFSNYLELFKNDQWQLKNSYNNFKISNFVEFYIDRLLNHITNYLRDLKDWLIVLDLANGALSKYAHIIYKKLGAKVEVFENKPNGFNINLNCGATYIQNLKYIFSKISQKHPKCIGFSFDGDGDRVLAIYNHNKKPFTIEGDVSLLLISKYLKDVINYKISSVALTHMSTLGTEEAFKNIGIEVIRTPVGDKYLTQAILEGKADLGAEQSGHIVIPPFLYTGDGILASLYLLASLKHLNFSQIINSIPKSYQKLINIPVLNKQKFMEKNQELFNKITKSYKDTRFYVRPSGTEDVIRILIESKEIQKIKEIEDIINKEVIANV
ncbi:MAG: hypothetical protein ACK4ZM_01920 [bacterium]